MHGGICLYELRAPLDAREAGGGTRTHGRLITNQVLYQLSYSGTCP